MTSPQVIYLLRWIIGNTFRQALASSVFWVLLGFSALAIVFCLGISIDGGDVLYHSRTGEPLTEPAQEVGTLKLCFGAFRVSLSRDRDAVVHLIQVILGSWLAGGVGLLVMLVWTAGFIPEALQPENAAVQFAKPTPRWLFLVGQYVGVNCFVACHAAIFFGGTWLALGARTDVWRPEYLLGLPLLILHFAAIYAVSACLGACTRSTVAASLGSILFWGLCFAVNEGRHNAVALTTLHPQSQPLPAVSMFLLETTYWLLPKPADFFHMLSQALRARAHMSVNAPEFAAVESLGRFDPFLAVLTTLLFSAVPLTIGGRRLEKTDY